ncbi:hypothetical protein R3P38DRAFT_2758388 [Favolaschia claudopus]|uniref:Uncharacterized protein n=1 Tax=Favolaschia claudopus TaxID=2862362 RepID=A0AAW0ED89_9AGAR
MCFELRPLQYRTDLQVAFEYFDEFVQIVLVLNLHEMHISTVCARCTSRLLSSFLQSIPSIGCIQSKQDFKTLTSALSRESPVEFVLELRSSLDWYRFEGFVGSLSLARDRNYADRNYASLAPASDVLQLQRRNYAIFVSDAETLPLRVKVSLYFPFNAETMLVSSQGKPMPLCIARAARAHTIEALFPARRQTIELNRCSLNRFLKLRSLLNQFNFTSDCRSQYRLGGSFKSSQLNSIQFSSYCYLAIEVIARFITHLFHTFNLTGALGISSFNSIQLDSSPRPAAYLRHSHLFPPRMRALRALTALPRRFLRVPESLRIDSRESVEIDFAAQTRNQAHFILLPPRPRFPAFFAERESAARSAFSCESARRNELLALFWCQRGAAAPAWDGGVESGRVGIENGVLRGRNGGGTRLRQCVDVGEVAANRIGGSGRRRLEVDEWGGHASVLAQRGRRRRRREAGTRRVRVGEVKVRGKAEGEGKRVESGGRRKSTWLKSVVSAGTKKDSGDTRRRRSSLRQFE